jgi:hypothetical protein
MKNCADRQLRRHGGPTWRAGGFWGGFLGGLGVLGVRESGRLEIEIWRIKRKKLPRPHENATRSIVLHGDAEGDAAEETE